MSFFSSFTSQSYTNIDNQPTQLIEKSETNNNGVKKTAELSAVIKGDNYEIKHVDENNNIQMYSIPKNNLNQLHDTYQRLSLMPKRNNQLQLTHIPTSRISPKLKTPKRKQSEQNPSERKSSKKNAFTKKTSKRKASKPKPTIRKTVRR